MLHTTENQLTYRSQMALSDTMRSALRSQPGSVHSVAAQRFTQRPCGTLQSTQNDGFWIAALLFSHCVWKLIIHPWPRPSGSTDQVRGSSLKTKTRLLMISVLQQYADLVLCHSRLGSYCFSSRKDRAEKSALERQVGQLPRVHHFPRNRATSKAHRHGRLPRQIYVVW